MPSPRSARIAGNATFTTVESRNAMADPRTVAAMTQRPAEVPNRTRGALIFGSWGSKLALDLVDLPTPLLHEIVIALHDGLEFLRVLRLSLRRPLHHLLERLQARHFHLGHEHPI